MRYHSLTIIMPLLAALYLYQDLVWDIPFPAPDFWSHPVSPAEFYSLHLVYHLRWGFREVQGVGGRRIALCHDNLSFSYELFCGKRVCESKGESERKQTKRGKKRCIEYRGGIHRRYYIIVGQPLLVREIHICLPYHIFLYTYNVHGWLLSENIQTGPDDQFSISLTYMEIQLLGQFYMST